MRIRNTTARPYRTYGPGEFSRRAKTSMINAGSAKLWSSPTRGSVNGSSLSVAWFGLISVRNCLQTGAVRLVRIDTRKTLVDSSV